MFRDVPGCSGMFRNVPRCSMFRVLSTPPGNERKEKRKGISGSSNGKLKRRNKSGKEKRFGLCKCCGTEHQFDRAKCFPSRKTRHKCGRQGHFAVKCHVNRQSPRKPDNKGHQTSGGHQRFAEDSD